MSCFLDNIDVNKVEKLIKNTEDNSQYFQQLTFNVVKDYVESLDILMNKIYNDIILVDQPPLNTLENYFLELSNCLFFMGDKLEKLGIYDSLSKSAYKEIYNTAYLNYTDIGSIETKKKPTVAEITANAEKESQYESIMSDIYAKAYKIVKNKIDAASTMLNSISKIISKRMVEMQLNSFTPSGKTILNENFTPNLNSSGNNLIDQFNYNKVIC